MALSRPAEQQAATDDANVVAIQGFIETGLSYRTRLADSYGIDMTRHVVAPPVGVVPDTGR